MTLRKITCPDLATNAVFIADVDEMIRCPNGEYEVVCVAIYGGRTIKPILLTIEDGTWRFDKVPDPAGTLQALVRLAKVWLPRTEIGRQTSNRKVRIFEHKQGPPPDKREWAVVAHWDAWNYRGLQWNERQAEFEKLGDFGKMTRTGFASLCQRTLKLKYLPRKSDAAKAVILRHHRSCMREREGISSEHDGNRTRKTPTAPRRAKTS
jgi:hypothetical protein